MRLKRDLGLKMVEYVQDDGVPALPHITIHTILNSFTASFKSVVACAKGEL